MDLVSEISGAIDRAAEMGFYEPDRRVRALQSMKEQHETKGYLSDAQKRYLQSLLRKFSIEERDKFLAWKEDWEKDEHIRERGDVISKYYIAQGSWFISVARVVQDNLKGLTEQIPDFYQFHKMTLNEYAEKVWSSHSSKHRWSVGDLVCCRSDARIDGWTYQIKAQGIDVNKDPCMVLESGCKPITNASKYDEKRGGCRWVSINPVGTTHIFQVMEKDLKIYRQPKKRSKK
jgi:hypothetical protein